MVSVFARVTSDNQGFIGKREFGHLQSGSVLLLMRRGAVVDFDDFLRQVKSGASSLRRTSSKNFADRRGRKRRMAPLGFGILLEQTYIEFPPEA